MKCIRCGHDSKFKERTNRTCPQCRGRFAFEPREGAKLTDQAFQHAIERVSGNGKLRWGAEHLYYEICRRLRPRFLRSASLSGVGSIAGTLLMFVIFSFVAYGFFRTWGLVVVVAAAVLYFATTGGVWLLAYRRQTVSLDADRRKRGRRRRQIS